MAFVASGFEDDSLQQLGALDQLDQIWKQGVRTTTNNCSITPPVSIETGGAQSIDPNMAEQNASAINSSALPQAVDLEATPDLEVKIKVVYADNRIKNLEGSLNPTRNIQQLKARLATQLSMQPHLVEMFWSKKLNNGEQAQPELLDNSKNLMSYGAETDDTIIIRETAEH